MKNEAILTIEVGNGSADMGDTYSFFGGYSAVFAFVLALGLALYPHAEGSQERKEGQRMQAAAEDGPANFEPFAVAPPPVATAFFTPWGATLRRNPSTSMHR
jgi:hypothetical protein